MQCRALLPGLLVCGVLMMPRPLQAATITQNTVADFQNGVSDGIAVPMGFAPFGSGAVGVMPSVGSPIVTEDFTGYTTQAQAEAGGWFFTTPNPGEHTELTANPTSVDFTGNPGAMRIHASRAQDLWTLNTAGQRSPFLALWNTPISGDFVAETKITFPQPRVPGDNRTHGLIITQAQQFDVTDGKLTQLTMDQNTTMLVDAVQFDTSILTWTWGPTLPFTPVEWGGYPGQTWYVRVVKQGAYFYVYSRNATSGPWIFENFYKMPGLVGSPENPVFIGFFEKSWGGVGGNATQYSDTDYDYLHVSRVGADSGSYTNVMDAKAPVSWQTFSLNTESKQGTKYQLRAGNTLAAGTLTDAGAFAGPDGTSASYFVDDTFQPIPNAQGKRYLEYKLVLNQTTTNFPGQTAANLPAKVRSVSATYEPAGLGATLATASAFNANAGGLEVQPGGTDVSTTRSQVFLDDFTSTTLDGSWTLDPGYTVIDSSVVGEYSLTDRPGWLRMKVGYPQDFFGTGIKQGGVKLLRSLPAGVDVNNFEIETEVNLENQQGRMAMLLMWEGPNDYIGITASRRDTLTWEFGLTSEPILNDGTPLGLVTANYGSNSLQLRVTKVGQIVTLSYRDVAVPSPSWHVLQTINVAGAATGGADFAPTQIGLMGKSYGPADTSPQNYDFAYLKVSSLSATGTQNVTLAVPAGSTPESLLPQGDDIAGQVRFQIKNGTGTLVGPDGTSASYFTTYEPKLPASLAGLTSLEVATTIDSTTGGVAYLHNLGVQYVKPGTRLAHDTNKADFAAGPVQNGVDLTTLPGEMTPTIGTGTIQTEEFNAPPASWAWSNNPPGTSSYSFTGGNAELNCVSVTDLWGAGTSAEKPRAVLYNGTLVTGDFELETKITFQGPRDVNRHQGLAIIQANTSAGATVDTKLDLTNMIVFGPYQPDGMRMMRADNNNFADFGPGGYTGLTYWLRLRKMGNVFTGYVSEDGVNYTQLDSYTLSHAMPSMYVGFSAKAWPGSNGTQTMDFDYLKITPYTTTGTFESRVLDLGTADTGAMLDSLGGNSAAVQLQFRAANTEAALASLPFIGPDGTAGTSYSGTYTGGLAGISGRYIQYRATLPIGTRLSDVSIISAAVSVLPFSKQDAMNAMKIAGGLQAATAGDITRLDVVKGTSAGKIDLTDAAQILRSVNGL